MCQILMFLLIYTFLAFAEDEAILQLILLIIAFFLLHRDSKQSDLRFLTYLFVAAFLPESCQHFLKFYNLCEASGIIDKSFHSRGFPLSCISIYIDMLKTSCAVASLSSYGNICNSVNKTSYFYMIHTRKIDL